MKCEKVQENLDLFLEGVLNLRLSNKIEKHLSVCKKCQEEKAAFQKVWQVLDNVPQEELSPNFTKSLMQRIHLEQAQIKTVKYPAPRLAWRFAYSLAPVLALIIVVVLVSRRPISIKEPSNDLIKMPESITTTVPLAIETKLEVVSTAIIDSDEEIIRDIDLLQNLEILQNLDIISELDFIESVDDTELGII